MIELFGYTINLSILLPGVISLVMISLAAGSLGTVALWNRMSYFGDTLAHASLLGAGIALILHFDALIGMLAVAAAIAMLFPYLRQCTKLPNDALLSVLSQSGIAISMLLIGSESMHEQHMTYLFGDLFQASLFDMIQTVIIVLILFTILCLTWRALLAVTVHPEIAFVEGYPVRFIQTMLLLMLVILIAISAKIVGLLLINALLVVPAATARLFAKSALQMFIYAACIALLATCFGIWMSTIWYLLIGPAIAFAAVLIFIIVQCLASMKLIR